MLTRKITVSSSNPNPKRLFAKRHAAICRTNQCGHFVKCPSGSDGCALHPSGKPGRLRNHLQDGGGCLRPEAPLFHGYSPEPIDLSPFVYAGPAHRGVDIVTFHYNPIRFNRLRETYYEWLPSLGSLADQLQCYELVFDDDAPEIDGSIVIRGDRRRNQLWQKEAIVNVALSRSRARYFAWLDHDIIFASGSWLPDSLRMLGQGYVAVQLFSRFARLDLDRCVLADRPSAMASGFGSGNPGGAWIADRKWLTAIGGLNTANIFGGGDQTFFDVSSGTPGRHLREYSDPMRHSVSRWIERAHEITAGRRFGHIANQAYHLWHGDHANRQYATRYQLIRDHHFNPDVDIRLGATGLLEWATDKPELHAGLARFFANRREDSEQASV